MFTQKNTVFPTKRLQKFINELEFEAGNFLIFVLIRNIGYTLDPYSNLKSPNILTLGVKNLAQLISGTKITFNIRIFP